MGGCDDQLLSLELCCGQALSVDQLSEDCRVFFDTIAVV